MHTVPPQLYRPPGLGGSRTRRYTGINPAQVNRSACRQSGRRQYGVVHVRAAFLSLLLVVTGTTTHAAEHRPRAPEAGMAFGILPTGPLNAITDVAGVKVGQVTLIEGANVRTGVTAILAHGGNLYQDKVPAGFAV